MKLLFVADGDSPIARSWIGYFIAGGHQVDLISTRSCEPMPGLRSQAVVPVAFSGLASSSHSPRGRPAWWRSAATIELRTLIRHWLGPLTVRRAGHQLRRILEDRQPDLVHAMRIPFEGAVAAAAAYRARLLLSTWGNDLTLHAPASPLMRRMTRRSLRRAAALHTDCQRDQRLASHWGYDPQRPGVVLPGNGGVRTEIFYAGPPGTPQDPDLQRFMLSLAPEAPLVLNPRGFRAYVRSDSFFRAVPTVVGEHPQVRFACVAMAGEPRAERWIDRLGVSDSITLLPKLVPSDLAVLMRRAQVMVSPSEHDGTPNTLLEAMACGAYPVLGRLESVAEWIDHGVSGSLVDPRQPRKLAAAVSHALASPELRMQAAKLNQQRIAERAEYSACMAQAERFYRELLVDG